MDLTGAVDMHVHTAPDAYPRSVDDHELVREAADAGMRALLLKSHHTLTADRAALARPRTGPHIEVFGGLALNWPVGGLNPIAVETAIAFGAKQIWMPTLHARHCMEVAEAEMFRAEARKGREGLTLRDGSGRLHPAIRPILEQIREAEIVLGTGHLAPAESLDLLQIAADMGLRKLLATHPMMSFTRFTLDQMRAAVDLGAYLEFDYLACSPNWHGAVPPSRTAEGVRAVGPEHCVLATDGGQTFNPHPPAMLRSFAEAMQAEGFGEAEIRRMICENPARLLDL